MVVNVVVVATIGDNGSGGSADNGHSDGDRQIKTFNCISLYNPSCTQFSSLYYPVLFGIPMGA